MDDGSAAAPLPVVFIDSNAPYLDTALGAVAMEKAAHALDWALRGDSAHHVARWVHVTRASTLSSPDLEAALRADGVCAHTASTLARRIAPLTARTTLAPCCFARSFVTDFSDCF